MEHLIREFLSYNEETGQIVWTKDKGKKIKAGSVAGSNNGIGYLAIKFNGKNFKAHRIAWLLKTGQWPVGVIDHINRDRSDNRWENLRSTTVRGNSFNRGLSKNNKSGTNGVYYAESAKKWRAMIRIDGKRVHLGYFKEKSEAELAYNLAKTEYHIVEVL